MELLEISVAGNVTVPAYLALMSKGYKITNTKTSADCELWTAEGSLGIFNAEDTVSLLGVVAMAELRGSKWKATDAEIDAFLSQFGH